MSQVTEQIHTYESAIKNIPGAGVICHEVAEIGISVDIGMAGPFRRWLCEGAANHIAIKTLEKFISKKAARSYAAEFNTKQFRKTKTRVDLAAWRAMEWDVITPPWVEQDTIRDYYTHATKAFENYIASAGPAMIPELFKRIAASNDKTDAGMYAALYKVTGKDIRTLLETEYPPAKSPFRGFAAQLLSVRPIIKKEDGSWGVMEASDVIPFSKDTTRGFTLIMTYASLGQPVELKVEFMGEGMKAPDRFSRMLVNITDTIAVDRIFGEGDLKPGPAVITVFINGAVLQTRRLQIREEG